MTDRIGIHGEVMDISISVKDVFFVGLRTKHVWNHPGDVIDFQ